MRRAGSRGLLLALALALPGCTGGAEPARTGGKPMRIMSLNLCADQILLDLVPPDRIASVTWLARDPSTSLMADAAQRVAVNHGLAEEVLRQQPDLILVGLSTPPALRAMLTRLGYPVVEAIHASSFEDIRTLTRQIAGAVGESARGEAMIARMDAQLDRLAREAHPRVRIAAWDRTGFGAGEGSLQYAIFKAAGADNIAARPPISGYGKPDAEVLLQAAPDLLVQGASVAAPASLGDYVEQHRVVRRFWVESGRMLTVPQATYMCGTPRVAGAVARLRADLRVAASGTDARLPIGAPQ